jgi:hypothetical protein
MYTKTISRKFLTGALLFATILLSSPTFVVRAEPLQQPNTSASVPQRAPTATTVAPKKTTTTTIAPKKVTTTTATQRPIIADRLAIKTTIAPAAKYLNIAAINAAEMAAYEASKKVMTASPLPSVSAVSRVSSCDPSAPGDPSLACAALLPTKILFPDTGTFGIVDIFASTGTVPLQGKAILGAARPGLVAAENTMETKADSMLASAIIDPTASYIITFTGGFTFANQQGLNDTLGLDRARASAEDLNRGICGSKKCPNTEIVESSGACHIGVLCIIIKSATTSGDRATTAAFAIKPGKCIPGNSQCPVTTTTTSSSPPTLPPNCNTLGHAPCPTIPSTTTPNSGSPSTTTSNPSSSISDRTYINPRFINPETDEIWTVTDPNVEVRVYIFAPTKFIVGGSYMPQNVTVTKVVLFCNNVACPPIFELDSFAGTMTQSSEGTYKMCTTLSSMGCAWRPFSANPFNFSSSPSSGLQLDFYSPTPFNNYVITTVGVTSRIKQYYPIFFPTSSGACSLPESANTPDECYYMEPFGIDTISEFILYDGTLRKAGSTIQRVVVGTVGTR